MAEENEVTANKLTEVTTKEPQQVTTKNPKKIEACKRLAEYNRRKKEELKAQKQKSEGPTTEKGKASRVSQNCGIGAVIAVGVLGSLDYYIYRTEQPSHPEPPQQPWHSQ